LNRQVLVVQTWGPPYLKKGKKMKIKFLTVSLMLILPFSVFAANTVVEKAVIESNNTYKAKYNLEDMTEFNQAQKGLLPSQQVKLKVRKAMLSGI
jgi:hypothetical protein